jgi:hypothetical protein
VAVECDGEGGRAAAAVDRAGGGLANWQAGPTRIGTSFPSWAGVETHFGLLFCLTGLANWSFPGRFWELGWSCSNSYTVLLWLALWTKVLREWLKFDYYTIFKKTSG